MLIWFGPLGLQKEKCPECRGDVFVDPLPNGSCEISCSKCGQRFDRWPPPKSSTQKVLKMLL